MRVNYNMSAVKANNQLLRNETALAKSVEKLSSGLKINHAGDDAAGMAISNKMHAQISGLKQASRNSSDGVSVIDIADGALNETMAIVQRMRELAVQAANETNSTSDRESIQKEIDAIKAEVDRISQDTEFNQKALLNGNLDRRVYPNTTHITMEKLSDNVPARDYSITVLSDASQAIFQSDPDSTLSAQTSVGTNEGGIITINGVKIEINGGDSPADVYQKMCEGAELADVTVFMADENANVPYSTDGSNEKYAGYSPYAGAYDFSKALTFVSDEYGSKAVMEIKVSNESLANLLGLGSENITINGLDAKADLTKDAQSGDYYGFESTAAISTSGNMISIIDKNGFEMEVVIDRRVASTSFAMPTAADATNATSSHISVVPTVMSSTSYELEIEVTDMGTMTLQVGANAGQEIEVRIPNMSAESLGIDDLNYKSTIGCTKALDKLDKAIEKISETRSRLGACENRLEHAIANLNSMGENMTAAVSRIEDVDMAEEMTEYTSKNVLVQAATSVLSQANDLPETALQLLQ
ncbi:flagellin [Acetitomaculum ruminis DSM 5522]|uniref:Flagellin n=1 Tax=Acetitomaculum ruminis DSM 5522 TaxID=1120918 RepID=A0A1I0YA99_9FIRM|nr:flagellin [Acetitomaculum ruminis]SFB09440.1 flagellin [Acetitomaculum ruminis DSM 5522]